MMSEHDHVAPAEQLRPDLPTRHAEGDERQDRDQAGDDPVTGLVLDRLHVGGGRRSRWCGDGHRAQKSTKSGPDQAAGYGGRSDRRDRSSSLSPGHRGWSGVKQFFRKAYEDNLTGLSGMLAYNLLLSLLPVTLLALFVAGQVLQSGDVERNVLADLRDLFPDTAESTLTEPARRSARLLHGPRHRGPDRERVDRHVVLGCARHGVLHDLPRALPQLARAEALRACDAGGRAPVRVRDRDRADRAGPSDRHRGGAAVRAVRHPGPGVRRHAGREPAASVRRRCA